MLRRFYDWTMGLAENRHAGSALFAVSFIESSFFPIPPDVMLIPMVLAQRAKAWFYAAIATVGSVIGGFFGYAIGFFLFEQVAKPLLSFYGYLDKFATFASQYNDYGAWIVLFAGITPFPYKVITIASGATALNLAIFGLASVVARGLRFYVVAALLYWFGPPIRAFIEERLGLVLTVFLVLLFGGFLAIRFFV
ncbi:MAG: DedA family protein [Hyphomicrobiaceae bacterium]|nr:DedA family protein [Hyphomicrobiaceae bacterium]MCC0007144.1 DedA family protein [Hyphomicrobiaceae bacterium]